jgi:hypothetical protein
MQLANESVRSVRVVIELKVLEYYQIQIQVVGLQVFQCLVETLLHIIGVMMCVPELASNLNSRK